MRNLILFFISMAVLASCSKHDFESYTYADKQRNDFEASFEKEFGTPASDQDWGFSNVTLFDYTHASTRGHDVNRNEWASKYNIPATVTHAEEKAIMDYLDNLTGWSNLTPQEKKTFVGTNRDSKPTFDWSQYFVWHVHKGTEIQDDNAGQNIGVVSNKMNHLQAVYADGTMEHINDFNHGANPAHGNSLEAATLMVNSTTYDFAYHNSIDNKYHNTYTVVDGSLIGYPGFYYICFDFFANGDIEQPANKNMGCSRNYNYTDWIVRICPAQFNMDGAVRIIAEDLGDKNGSDFDYNDVVFDAKVAKEWVGDLNGNYFVAYITLRAAGGTLPLTVAGEEVHSKFGVDVGTMYNTNAYGEGIDYNKGVSFTAYLRPIGNNEWNLTGEEVAKSIPIVVTYKNGEQITLTCETGKAPEKICVNSTFKWQEEYINIRNKYPLFADWVLDKSVKWQ